MEETQMIESVGPIVATAETGPAEDALGALEQRVRELESAVAGMRTLKAQAEPAGRRTMPPAQASLLAKGISDEGREAPLEDALRSLSMEQRFAVKTGLIRAGLLR